MCSSDLISVVLLQSLDSGSASARSAHPATVTAPKQGQGHGDAAAGSSLPPLHSLDRLRYLLKVREFPHRNTR